MPASTLAGRLIAVTRPAGQADSLCAAIAERGGEALRLPLLDIAPLQDPAPLQALAARLADIHLVFFVSPNAVRHGLPPLLAGGPLPAGLQVATVGLGSERALHDLGIDKVIAPRAGFDSEAVLALPAFQAEAVRGREVVILRGDGGRELLGDTLRQRGARVTPVTCYRRLPPAADPAPLLSAARRGALDALILTSSEAADKLAGLLGTALETVLAVPVLASHPRIAARAATLGFTTVWTAAPGDAGLVAALESHLGNVR